MTSVHWTFWLLALWANFKPRQHRVVACGHQESASPNDAALTMSATMRRRTYTRAAVAWQAGRSHQAWEILAASGLADEWTVFLRFALRFARSQYLRRMPPTA